ncbi:hypothetical protein PSP6_130029 [Paraburkholderia tropica]|nr:hypothetical protein PSP6_130029 [Paraburkholderia tropica]
MQNPRQIIGDVWMRVGTRRAGARPIRRDGKESAHVGRT